MQPLNFRPRPQSDDEKRLVRLEIEKTILQNTDLRRSRARFWLASVWVPLACAAGAGIFVWATGVLQAQGALNEAKAIEFGLKRDELHKTNDSLQKRNEMLTQNSTFYNVRIKGQDSIVKLYDSVLNIKDKNLNSKNKYVAGILRRLNDLQSENAQLQNTLNSYQGKILFTPSTPTTFSGTGTFNGGVLGSTDLTVPNNGLIIPTDISRYHFKDGQLVEDSSRYLLNASPIDTNTEFWKLTHPKN